MNAMTKMKPVKKPVKKSVKKPVMKPKIIVMIKAAMKPQRNLCQRKRSASFMKT